MSGAEPPGRLYRRVKLDQLAADGPAVEQLPYLPASELYVPPLAFGDIDLPRAGLDETPRQGAAGRRQLGKPVSAYVLHDALVHGDCGVVTLGDRLVDDNLTHLPLHRMPDVRCQDVMHLRLPLRPVTATVPSAYHLLASNHDNYFHFLFDAVSRFSTAAFQVLGRAPAAAGNPILLVPPPDVAWKRELLALAVPPGVPIGVLPADATVLVRRLVYIPGLTDGFLMHREVLSVLDRIRAAAFDALGGAAALPWRRIYVSRADAWLRRLTNEAEITELAERAGFTPVTLTGMPVAEQVRLFAEASHIVAPHGAGLANIGFCRPGAALCELQMDAYVQWSFRHLAARRRVRYGCVIGRVEAPRAQWVHNDSWRIDPAAVVAALRDGRFGR